MIKLYIFDQGGVVNRDFDCAPEASKRLGITVAQFRAAMGPDIMAYMRGEFPPSEFWRRFKARAGVGPAEGEDLWDTCFRPRVDAETQAIVRELAAKARVVSGTNTIGVHHETNIRLGHYEGLHAVYASHLIHAAKPEPEFWLHILKAEGVRPEEAFFTDDFPENIAAASALGLAARLYTSAARLRADLLDLGAPLSPALDRHLAAHAGGAS